MHACVRAKCSTEVGACTHEQKNTVRNTTPPLHYTQAVTDCHTLACTVTAVSCIYQLYRTSPSRYPGANLLKDAAVVLQRTLPNGWRCHGANSNGVCVDSVRAVMHSEVHGERMQRCFSARVPSNATTSSSKAHVSRKRKEQATAPERSPMG